MSKRKAFNAIALLWLGALFGAGLAFLTQIVLARKLGSEEYGVFSAVLAMVTLVTPLAGFGVPQLWLKVFGQEGWKAIRWFKSSFKFVGTSTIIVLLSLFLWAFFGNHDQLTRMLILIISLYVIGQVSVELVSSKLQLEERYIYFAVWQFLPHFSRFFLVCILAFGFSGWATPENIAYLYAFVAIVFSFAGVIQLLVMSKGNFSLKGHGKKEVIQFHIPDIIILFKNAWPFGLAGIFHLIYFQSDIILLEYLTGAESTGIYNVAFVVMVAVYLLPSVIYQKFMLPKLHPCSRIRGQEIPLRYTHHNSTLFKAGNTK